MFDLFCLWFGAALRIVRNRQNLLMENLALRQQLVVLKRRHPKPKLGVLDKLFWAAARRFWSQWKQSLFIVMPETVVRGTALDSDGTGPSCAKPERQWAEGKEFPKKSVT